MKAATFVDLFQEAKQHEDYWVSGATYELAEEIFNRMEELALSRSELARRLGTSPTHVTKILRGEDSFNLKTLVGLARALEADLKIELRERHP